MKFFKINIYVLGFLSIYAGVALGFSTHNNVTVSRTFDKVETTPNSPITVTVSFSNLEENDIQGFYFTEQIPDGLQINNISVKLGESEIGGYIFESGSMDEVFEGYTPYRWILETPPAFLEYNPISANTNLKITYTITSTVIGVFDFKEFSWVGYFFDALEGERPAFGHSEADDEMSIIFKDQATNIPPIAHSDTVGTKEDTSVVINILDNDIDVDGAIDPATLTIARTTSNGIVTINSDWTITYKPTGNFNGIDSFSYTIKDNNAAISNEATVMISVSTVNDAPVVSSGNAVTSEDNAVSISLNGSDIDRDSISYKVIEQPTHGALNGQAPNFSYMPTPNYNGVDSFTFKANDGSLDSTTETFTILISPVNDAPVAHNSIVNTNEGTPMVVILTATDIDGNQLTYVVNRQPSHGTLSGTAPNLSYSPTANFNGTDSIEFTATDGVLSSNVAVVNITIKSINHSPVAIDDVDVTDENTEVTIQVTQNDSDEDGKINQGTVHIVTPPINGVTTLNSNGSVLYKPAVGFYGTDVFVYTVNDDEGGVSNAATVTITVTKQPVLRKEIDLIIKAFKNGETTEDEVTQKIKEYMEQP